jgi:hypothetical protein
LTGIELLARFFSSGLFFMIVGGFMLYAAYRTIGTTHSVMSFVFVVAGVAILLFGTGTQGMGKMDTGPDPTSVLRYQVALAGGAGVVAFCVAAGMIAFPGQIKSAFLPSQSFIKLTVQGDGFHNDLEKYRYVATVNGTRVPTVQNEQFIEILAPYVPSPANNRFRVFLHLHSTTDLTSDLRP